jgi:hypothetical protein
MVVLTELSHPDYLCFIKKTFIQKAYYVPGTLLRVYKQSILTNNTTRERYTTVTTSLQVRKLSHEKNKDLATQWQSWE